MYLSFNTVRNSFLNDTYSDTFLSLGGKLFHSSFATNTGVLPMVSFRGTGKDTSGATLFLVSRCGTFNSIESVALSLYTRFNKKYTVDILDVNISDHQFIHINRCHCTKEKSKLEFIGRSYKNYNLDVFCNNLLALD